MRRPTRLVTPRPAGRARSLPVTLAAALGLILVLAGLAWLGVSAQRGLPGKRYYELTAEFHDAANIGRYAEVRIAGRRAGQVVGIEARRGVARLDLQLNGDLRPLRADTTARIRLKGLLGAKFVDLSPGRHGAPLPQGATIPPSRTSTTVELFDVVESLDERRRASLRSTVRGLGTGFVGRGDELNAALTVAPRMLRDLTATARSVNARRGAAARFVPSLESAAAAYDPVRTQLARGFEPQARALRPFVDRRSAVQETLEVAPAALETMRRGLAQTDPLLVEMARFSRATVRFARPAPVALRGAAALLRESRRPLRSSRTLLEQTARAVPPTLELTARVDPLIAPSIRSMRNSMPVLRELGRRRCDLLGFARNWRGMLGFGIPSRHEIGPQTALRVEGVANERSVGDTPGKGIHPQPASRYLPYCQLGPVAPVVKGGR